MSRRGRSKSRGRQQQQKEEEWDPPSAVEASSADELTSPGSGFFVFRVVHFLALYVVGGTAATAWWHYHTRHSAISVMHLLINFFVVINVVVSVW